MKRCLLDKNEMALGFSNYHLDNTNGFNYHFFTKVTHRLQQKNCVIVMKRVAIEKLVLAFKNI